LRQWEEKIGCSNKYCGQFENIVGFDFTNVVGFYVRD
jgi:hypothetical protein